IRRRREEGDERGERVPDEAVQRRARAWRRVVPRVVVDGRWRVGREAARDRVALRRGGGAPVVLLEARRQRSLALGDAFALERGRVRREGRLRAREARVLSRVVATRAQDDSFIVLFVVVLLVASCLRCSARDEPDADEGQRAAADELASVVARVALEVAVEDGAADDDAEREEHELRRDHLRRLEALQRAVDVLNLHDGGEDEDGQQQVGDRERQRLQQRVRQKRGHALGRQRRVAAEQPDQSQI